MILIFASCPKCNECGRNFYISGTVADQMGNPIQGVEVHYVTHYGFDSASATTDAQGKFSQFHGSYTNLGNSYIYYRKAGFQDLTTPVIGKGNGACGDQQIIRDGVMVP
ncbi:MAG: carboxypeptidase-like regulatory domain-containing protein [Bdellovibrionota bacterium]